MKHLSREKKQAIREWRRGPSDVPPARQKSAREVLDKLLPKLGLAEQVEQSRLITDWEKIVGATNARHSKPTSFRNGVLMVSVDHSIWRMQFEPLKPLWLQKIRAYLKPKPVREIVFRVEG